MGDDPLADVRAGQAGSPGEPGTSERAGQGGQGGAGGAGGAGDPGGAGGGGGSGGPFVGSRGRRRISTGSFVVFVILVPLWAGLAWTQHQHGVLQDKVEQHQLLDDWRIYDAQIAMCERINVLRDKQNAVIVDLKLHHLRFAILPTKTVACTTVIPRPSGPRPPEE